MARVRARTSVYKPYMFSSYKVLYVSSACVYVALQFVNSETTCSVECHSACYYQTLCSTSVCIHS